MSGFLLASSVNAAGAWLGSDVAQIELTGARGERTVIP